MENEQNQLTCDGFDVWIALGGKKATTYGVEHKEIGKDKQTSCWICSEKGKEFSVCFNREQFSGLDYSVKVLLDGHKVGNYTYGNEHGKASSQRKISYSRTSSTAATKFAFGSLEVTDDDAYLDNSLAQNVGEIKVVIRTVEITGLSPDQTLLTYAIPTVDKIHERSKKGLAHHIQYVPIDEKAPQIRRYLYRSTGGEIVFIFKYRPIEMLQAAGIAPRPMITPDEQQPGFRSTSPMVVPNERGIRSVKREHSDDEESDFAEEDVDDLVAKAHALLAKAQSIRAKQRVKKDGAPAKKKVKTEPMSVTPGEVIDLT